MRSLQRLFSPFILLLILLSSCGQRQIHNSSNQDQLRQLSPEIEAGWSQQFSGPLAMKEEPSGLVAESGKLVLKKQVKVKPEEKFKEISHKSGLGFIIKSKKLIKGIKEIRGVKKSEQNNFNSENIVLKIGLWTFVIGLL